ncbi:hypothetical protein [Salibacter halophilus]|uniref:Polysaccharide deacetylase family protein n=1 Tax=Salibacter halophilus TaxID=1803916 RepID=A0A6N6M312_9FLAO|nr:hypothetical protein [Salibacter halophilus]KAB1063540.1 hypothetical protein F3059_10765 [Salibacter halophilus]
MLGVFKRNIINCYGTSIMNPVVVFESDDWGMIRSRSKDSLSHLSEKGYPVEYCTYNRFDSIERNQDIIGLLEILDKHKSFDGSPAKFTINNIVANPDFDKIHENGYQKYYYQSFTETLKEYPETDLVMDLYRQGLKDGLIQSQFHGREHVNVNRWLDALKTGDKRFHDAFEERQFTVAEQGRTSGRRDYLDAFGRAYNIEFESEESIIRSGLDLFEEIWGFKSKSFIAPCYTWSPEIERHLFRGGVKYIQGTHIQRIPREGLDLKIKKKYHWQGRKNKSGLKSIVRNVMFEPSEHNSDPSMVDHAMAQIKNAFFWNKPAVISTHRVNYIGRLNPDNRDKNLRLLDKLLTQILKNYPDVRFMSSDELGKLYNK